MDWIERLLHIAPDGGNGTLEAMIGILTALVPLTALLMAKVRHVSCMRGTEHKDSLSRPPDP